MIRQPENSLPPGASVTARVVITFADSTTLEGELILEQPVEGSITFKAAGLALQAGVYEVLRAVWPQAG